MNAMWQMWKGALAPDFCQQIINDGLTLPTVEGTIGHGGTSKVDKDFRTSIVRWIPPSWKTLRETLDYYVRTANANAFGFRIDHTPDVQFTTYTGDELSHYDWHVDNSWKGTKPFDRKLSIVVMLSDPTDYDGGELELEHEPPEQEQLKQRGSVIVFPSFCRHRVKNVTRGIRHSLVAWAVGPRFI